MVYYKPVKITIDTPRLAEVIIDMVICHYGLLDIIVSDRGSIFISKFWSLFYYFLKIKRRLLKTFYPQTNSQIER